MGRKGEINGFREVSLRMNRTPAVILRTSGADRIPFKVGDQKPFGRTIEKKAHPCWQASFHLYGGRYEITGSVPECVSPNALLGKGSPCGLSFSRCAQDPSSWSISFSVSSNASRQLNTPATVGGATNVTGSEWNSQNQWH